MKPHLSLKYFVRSIEEMAREYVKEVEIPKEMVLAMRRNLCSAVDCKNNNVIVANDEIMRFLIVTVSSRSKYQAFTISTSKTDCGLIDNFIGPVIYVRALLA
ncbi:hypothetical protein F441_14896 [Phytophthora nicotianae CJ01A1]|uniref:Uncharacterized protein n=1 Tax=Phytophthora nicotianae CJ01A1 TaxID=1317063 RepID=W2WI12_PHYNI|nr:hypothetical protein F441_14896 [Phytophthora nicotianae CJ01A1]